MAVLNIACEMKLLPNIDLRSVECVLLLMVKVRIWGGEADPRSLPSGNFEAQTTETYSKYMSR